MGDVQVAYAKKESILAHNKRNCLTPIDRRVFVIVILSSFRVKSVSEKDILMMLN